MTDLLVPFDEPFVPARFVSREKRFIVHAIGEGGSIKGQAVTAHLADPGRLEGILVAGARLWLTGPYPAPRKLAWSLRMAEVRKEQETILVSLDSTLSNRALPAALDRGLAVKVGGVFTTDTFYHDDPDYWKLWAAHGILALEMETAALYTLAAQHGVDALTILTVTDDLVDGGAATAEERETAVLDMVAIALRCSA